MTAAPDGSDRSPAASARFRGWVELTRCSNLPTVWSNAVMGVAWGASSVVWTAGGGWGATPTWALSVLLNQGLVLLVAVSLTYTAGMVLNDVADAAVDARERPGRPIPSGRVSATAAAAVGRLALLTGLGLLVVYRGLWVLPLGTALAAAVVSYNALHRRYAWATGLLPLCRALLVLLGVAVGAGGVEAGGIAVDWAAVFGWALIPAALVAGDTLAISWYARREVERDAAVTVGFLLAMLPLTDALILAVIGQWPAAGLAMGCAALALAAQRVVPGS